MLEFGLKSYLKIKTFNPDILHVHDDTAMIGGLFYKTFHPNKKIIYDDHELKYIRPKSLSDCLFFLTDWLNNNKNDLSDLHKDIYGVLMIQLTFHSNHFGELIKHFYPDKHNMPFDKFNITLFIFSEYGLPFSALS